MNKRQTVIELMNKNPNKTRQEYIELICKHTGMTKETASNYYYYAVDSGRLNFTVYKRVLKNSKVKPSKTDPLSKVGPDIVQRLIDDFELPPEDHPAFLGIDDLKFLI